MSTDLVARISNISLPLNANEAKVENVKSLVAKVLAYYINKDRVITVDEYKKFRQIIENLFGPEYLDLEENRVSMHSALLFAAEDASDLQKQFLAQIQKIRMSRKSLETFLDTLLEVMVQDGSCDERDISFVNSIIVEFKIDNPLILNKFAALNSTRNFDNNNCGENKNFIYSVLERFKVGPKESSSRASHSFSTAKQIANEHARSELCQIRRAAKYILAEDLISEIDNFERSLDKEGFKVAIAGEIKHGKSSIFNSIVRQQISPIGYSTPKTAAIFELRYSQHPEYCAFWMDNDEISIINKYLENCKPSYFDKVFGENFASIIRHGDFSPGGRVERINSLEDIHEYGGVGGVFSCAVRKIEVGLPLEIIRSGVVISDTPGLNDPTKVRDFITLKECSDADCIVFVLRADKLCTLSETTFVSNLVDLGRVTELIFVITHHEDGAENGKVDKLKNYVSDWYKNIQGTGRLSVAGIFVVNAKHACEQICDKGFVDSSEFLKFYDTLSSVCLRKGEDSKYCSMVDANLSRLKELCANKMASFLTSYEMTLSSESSIVQLKHYSDNFEKIYTSLKDQIVSRLSGYGHELNDFHKKLDKMVENLNDILHTSVKECIEAEVIRLGKDYADQKRWKKIDQEVIPQLVADKYNKFVMDIDDKFKIWMAEIDRFSEQTSRDVEVRAVEFLSSKDKFENICKTNNAYVTVMSKVDTVNDVLAKSAIAATSGLVGAGLVTSGASLLATASLMTPAGWVILLGLTGIAASYNIFKDVDKRKLDYINKRLDGYSKQIVPHLESLKSSLESSLVKIADQFKAVAESKYCPLLISYLNVSTDIRLRYEVELRIRGDFTKMSQAYLSSLR